MKVIKWTNPLSELMGVRNTFKNFLSDDFMKDFKENADFTPGIEIVEHNDKWNICAELPGIKKEDINIQLEDGLLKTSGKVENKKEVKENNYYYSERKYGTFARSIEIPDDVKPEEISAEYTDGVLNVSIPKHEKPKEVKKIEIK
ncbi:MAG TPA: Hsp20/alpha crystallin family protein [Candidatus Wallbacteria bacterium]|nr:Hsp20/alpha crystallin family protein [Candidatus Wallbacteria bacterium]